jgi:predicted nucleotide-binding protein
VPTAERLFQLADAVSEALSRTRSDDLKQPLTALKRECDTAKSAWSGSNLGYHARVYYRGVQPAGADFSPEWGLMDRWPVHQPDPGWEVMQADEVRGIILARAGIDDIDTLSRRLTSCRDELATLKEQGISLLSVVISSNKDPFLERKFKEVEGIVIASPGDILASIRVGSRMTRDSTALPQGTHAAPHQRLEAIHLSAEVSENGLNLLQRTLREAASHMVELTSPARPGKDTARVFIGHGHSPVWREFNDFITDRMGLPYDEFNRVPVAGITNISRLSEMLETAAIAFIIFTGEDEQADGALQPRMNAVHEAGLFQGHLGFSKAIVLLEDGCEHFTNNAGLGHIPFPKGNIAAVFEDVRRVLEREGLKKPGS